MSDWYQRKFGRPTGGGQRQAPPVNAPRQAYGNTTGTNNTNQFVQFQQQPTQIDPRTQKVTIGNLWDAMQNWRGGPAHRTDPNPCPNCGSKNFSARTTGIMRGPPPAPHCFNCGYNGMFEQGLASSWQPS